MIKASIEGRIRDNSAINEPTNIKINVSNGNGTSMTLWAKRQIAREVGRLAGVTKVVNNLKVN